MNKKLLYIDDEEINLMLFEANLEMDYTVLTAMDGQSGLQVLDDNPDVQVVFCDMKMPVMNGLQTVTKARENFPDKKFYLLTGFDVSDEIQAALDSGLITGYFRKPFEMEEIIEILETV